MQESRGFMEIAPRSGGDAEKLEYLWLGNPQGQSSEKSPILIFLHEGLGSVSMWRDFPASLAEATGLPALVYSRKGYGNSMPVDLPRPTSYMHDEAREIVGAILDHWDISDCILVGHSDGASIATIYAGKYNDDRVRGLILMAPHFFVEEESVAAIEASTIAWETTDFREKLKRYHGDNVDCAFWGWNRVWLENDFRLWNIEDYLPKLYVPILIIQGVDDPYGTARQWEAAQEKCTIPVTVAALPDCRHSPYRENEAQTMAACIEYIAEISPPKS